MRNSVLVAPGVAPAAETLSTTPLLELTSGQLAIIERSAIAGTETLHQAVHAIVPVPTLGLALVATDDELYVLPLAALLIQ